MTDRRSGWSYKWLEKAGIKAAQKHSSWQHKINRDGCLPHQTGPQRQAVQRYSWNSLAYNNRIHKTHIHHIFFKPLMGSLHWICKRNEEEEPTRFPSKEAKKDSLLCKYSMQRSSLNLFTLLRDLGNYYSYYTSLFLVHIFKSLYGFLLFFTPFGCLLPYYKIRNNTFQLPQLCIISYWYESIKIHWKQTPPGEQNALTICGTFLWIFAQVGIAWWYFLKKQLKRDFHWRKWLSL